ncbi:MAG: universal stress protein, partial [Saprospiraceae bacterium]|nr:universal stress protein [Saprospiraceae bacterium]
WVVGTALKRDDTGYYLASDYDYVVMGSTGETDFLDRVFGSVSAGVAKRAHCPVILVPKKIRFAGINQILYASNYESVDHGTLEQLLKFNKKFKAHIHFVHIRPKGKEDDDFDRAAEDIFEELFAEGDPPFAFDISEIDGEEVASALSKYADENKIDLVIMVSRHRSFWESIFHKSQTKKMAMSARLPLMVLQLE